MAQDSAARAFAVAPSVLPEYARVLVTERGISARMSGGVAKQFEGGVFSEAVEGGRSAASLSFSGSAVLATTPEGHLFTVPYQGARLSLGGASGKMWFCRSADGAVTVFSEASGFAEALRASAQKDLVERLDALEHSARDAKQRYFWLFTSLALLVLSVAMVGVYLSRNLSALTLNMVPPSLDQKLGKLVLENTDLGGEIANDKVLNDAVKQVLEPLIKAKRSSFRFTPRVVRSSQVNAFALPGGPIVIHTGLLREATGPEQLAGVLAHEMAHVVRRHGIQRIAQSVGVVAVIQLMFGDVSGVMAIGVELLRAGAVNSYSREQENQADMEAVDLMRAANLDPNALADFFVRLASKGTDLPDLLAWLGTHPELNDRISAVRRRAEQGGERETRPLAIDWDQVRRHAGYDPDQPN
jgi:beta-barrel assembly-enhancing protease